MLYRRNYLERKYKEANGFSKLTDKRRSALEGIFTADNIFGDGGEEIHFHKVWMDDGEEEYKDDVRVDISARGMQLPFPHGDTVAAPANWESMDDTTFNTQVSAVENNTGTSGWLFRTTERNNALTTLWSNDSPYLDPLRADVLGYHYLYAENGTTSVPKKYYGVGTTGTVDYYADITADSTTGDPLVFMLQRRPKNSTGAFETVTDSGLVAAINYENVDRQPTYTQTSATGNNRNRITLNAPNYLVNGKYYVKIKGVPAYRNNTPYTYDKTCVQIGGYSSGALRSIQLDSFVLGDAYEAEGTSKRDLVFSFSPDSSIVGTNETVGNSVTFAVRPSYNNGNTTSVHADSVEAYIPENTNQYNITNGQCTIPEEEKIFNRYRFRINDLPDGYEYRLVASDGTTVLNNTAPPVTVSASSNGYYYSRYALPLSANSYYANMSPSDSEQLTLLSNLLNTVNTAQEPHLLNTNHFMKEDNVWTARVQVRIGYSYHPRGSTAAGDSGDYGYDLRDFAEHIMSTKNQSNTFTLRNDITNSNNLSAMDWMNAIKPASSAWIDMLPAQYTTHFYAVSGELTGAASAYSYIVVDADGNEIEGAYASTVDTTPDITEVSSKKYRVVVTAENREGTNGSPLVFKLKRASYGSNNYSPVNNISIANQ